MGSPPVIPAQAGIHRRRLWPPSARREREGVVATRLRFGQELVAARGALLRRRLKQLARGRLHRRAIGRGRQRRVFPRTQVAALADDIAYNNHDIDDGLRAGLFTLEEIAELLGFEG